MKVYDLFTDLDLIIFRDLVLFLYYNSGWIYYIIVLFDLKNFNMFIGGYIY